MFEIGDVIRVKLYSDIKNNFFIHWANGMSKYCGNVYTIINKYSREGHTVYELDGAYAGKYVNDNGYWVFVDEWLEPVDDKKFEITENEFNEVFTCLE